MTKVRPAKEQKGTANRKVDRAEDEVKPLKGRTPWMPPGWNKPGRREGEAREDARKPGYREVPVARQRNHDSQATRRNLGVPRDGQKR